MVLELTIAFLGGAVALAANKPRRQRSLKSRKRWGMRSVSPHSNSPDHLLVCDICRYFNDVSTASDSASKPIQAS